MVYSCCGCGGGGNGKGGGWWVKAALGPEEELGIGQHSNMFLRTAEQNGSLLADQTRVLTAQQASLALPSPLNLRIFDRASTTPQKCWHDVPKHKPGSPVEWLLFLAVNGATRAKAN